MKKISKSLALLLSVVVMASVFGLNSEKAYAISVYDAPTTGDIVKVDKGDGTYGNAIITGCVPLILDKSSDWEYPLVVYLYTYDTEEVGLPMNPSGAGIGGIMSKMDSGEWEVANSYVPKEAFEMSFGQVPVAQINGMMNRAVMMWQDGSSQSSSNNKDEDSSSITAEEIAEQRAEAEQKAVEEKIAEEKALPVTSFTSTESVNSMPEAAKSTGASYNLTKVTTTQGFASAVEKIAASAKSQNTNNRRNASVTVYSDRPMTFSADILDAVSAADVDFSYIFRHGGKLYRITIPRGAKVDLGGKKFEGPLFIGRLLGTTQEIE